MIKKRRTDFGILRQTLFKFAICIGLFTLLTQANLIAQTPLCGTGSSALAYIDSDGDLVCDLEDWCPLDPNKIEPGTCGCGVTEDTGDRDGDGVINCKDECPHDPNKSVAGSCGCGVEDIDSDGDGVFDCDDECPFNPVTSKIGSCNDCEAPGITDIAVVNKENCEDDYFTGDIVISFNYPPVLGGIDITWNGGHFYYNFVNGNTSHVVTIPNQTFPADGNMILIDAEYRGNEGCNASMVAGRALTCIVPPTPKDPIDCFNPHGKGHGAITGITIDEIYKCSNRGTPHKLSDDITDARVTVYFDYIPSSGVLELTGMGCDYVEVHELSGHSYTFDPIRLFHGKTNTLKAVFASEAISHTSKKYAEVYSYFINENVFECEDPCNSFESVDDSYDSSHRLFTTLNVSQQDKQVELEWATNQSFKSVYYVLERSVDGINFEELTNQANGELSEAITHYEDIDQNPALGDNYYRLKQVFTDGTVEYTPTQKVNFGIDSEAVSFFPNPTVNELYIDLTAYQGKTAHLILSNQYGQIMEDIDFDALPSDLINLDFSNYANGLYFVRTKIGNSDYIVNKVLVSKF